MTLLIDFLGCKVNSYEVEAVGETFLKNGFSFFDKSKDKSPTVIIINTCAVTQTSVTKDRKIIKRYRKQYPESVLVVMGCYAQFDYKNISESLDADIVIGTSNRAKVYGLVDDFLKNHQKIFLNDENNSIKTYESISLTRTYLTTRAYVKIQDGCNNFCSYCLIPYIRGRSRSRKREEILNEISSLISNGVKEVVLTGIDMSSYGIDLDPQDTFSDLIEAILINNPNLYRLRISSLEISQIDDKFLELLANYPNLADHLHIPLQSGSEAVVKRMNRKYDIDGFVDKVSKIRKIRPLISITTDVIVGFPGESEDNFLETYNFCKNIRFSKIHVFPYSIRNGTVAAKFKDQISPVIKKERVNRLLELSNKLELEYTSMFFDKNIEFLFEDYVKEAKGYRGHSSNYLECILSSDENLENCVRKVLFTKDNFKYF